MPMLVVRHERTLAIDGDYVHVSFLSYLASSFVQPEIRSCQYPLVLS